LSPEKVLEKSWKIVFEKGYEPWSEQEINPVQIPHPSNATFKFPLPRAQCTVKCPGYAQGEGDVEVSN